MHLVLVIIPQLQSSLFSVVIIYATNYFLNKFHIPFNEILFEISIPFSWILFNYFHGYRIIPIFLKFVIKSYDAIF